MLNYMAAGLSIVCFDKDNNRKYLGDGGCYASAENAENLAEKISELINNSELRMKKGQINKENSLKFSWAIPAGRISEIYNIITKK